MDLAFGYDTYGIRTAISTGNFAYVLDGFYVSDFTLPDFKNGKVVPGTGGMDKDEFTLQATVGLGAEVNLGIIAAGLEGGVELTVGADFQDIGRSKLTKDEAGNVTNVQFVTDGKIRGTEIATMFEYEEWSASIISSTRTGNSICSRMPTPALPSYGPHLRTRTLPHDALRVRIQRPVRGAVPCEAGRLDAVPQRGFASRRSGVLQHRRQQRAIHPERLRRHGERRVRQLVSDLHRHHASRRRHGRR